MADVYEKKLVSTLSEEEFVNIQTRSISGRCSAEDISSLIQEVRVLKLKWDTLDKLYEILNAVCEDIENENKALIEALCSIASSREKGVGFCVQVAGLALSMLEKKKSTEQLQ
jgi:hypothetical protein